MRPHLISVLHLASPQLPVGGFAYSQGLEAAVEACLVTDAASASAWVSGVLGSSLARFEAPLLARLVAAWESGQATDVERLNGLFAASRETSELLDETGRVGRALGIWLLDLGVAGEEESGILDRLKPLTYPAAFACAAAALGLGPEDTVTVYLWVWLENQVMAAVKLVPLGQTAGQRLLLDLGPGLPAIAQRALELPESEWSSMAPGLAILSSRHETQYSRLFRS
jgi:urease accessory protein